MHVCCLAGCCTAQRQESRTGGEEWSSRGLFWRRSMQDGEGARGFDAQIKARGNVSAQEPLSMKC